VHDTKWLLWWAIRDIEHRALDFGRELGWLARILAAREFPLARLARDLEIAADVLDEREGEALDAVAQRLRAEANNLP
jgi:hypothetical protein